MPERAPLWPMSAWWNLNGCNGFYGGKYGSLGLSYLDGEKVSQYQVPKSIAAWHPCIHMDSSGYACSKWFPDTDINSYPHTKKGTSGMHSADFHVCHLLVVY